MRRYTSGSTLSSTRTCPCMISSGTTFGLGAWSARISSLDAKRASPLATCNSLQIRQINFPTILSGITCRVTAPSIVRPTFELLPNATNLTRVPFSRGFFARIGEGRRDGRTFEIWVLQQGMIPGSEYTLLARNGGKDDLIRSFRVLQSRCPKSNLLKARNLDVWQTRYCKINDRHQLLRFARRMLREPDYGTLELIEGVEEGPETEAPDPIDNPKN